MRTEPTLPFPVVGLLATSLHSASLAEFFAHLPAEPEMAFVIYSGEPRATEAESFLPFTNASRLPVIRVSNDISLKPNTVYYCSENKTLQIEKFCLRVAAPCPCAVATSTADAFLNSLATSHGGWSIGVSFRGVTALNGLELIRNHNGFAFAEDYTCLGENNSILVDEPSGIVDVVQGGSELPAYVARIGRTLLSRKLLPLQSGCRKRGEEQFFSWILSLLQSVNGQDYQSHQFSFLRKRIARRMILLQAENLGSYAAMLESNREELQQLSEDLRNSTYFFPKAQALATASQLVLAKEHKEGTHMIRAWVPGCGSGEEVYALAIELAEQTGTFSSLKRVQILGTDTDEAAIEKARLAVYSARIAQRMSPERLSRFFHRSPAGYQVIPEIREVCSFLVRESVGSFAPGQHNLIVCCHLLSCFKSSVRARLSVQMHSSLKAEGLLVAEPLEKVDFLQNLFSPQDPQTGIWRRSHTEQAFVPSSSHMETMEEQADLEQENTELVAENQELRASSNDSLGILRQAGIALLVAGKDARIRFVSQAAEQALLIRTTDIGRHLRDVNLGLLEIDAEGVATEVQRSLTPQVIEVSNAAGSRFVLRVSPFLSAEKQVSGVLFVLSDVEPLASRFAGTKQKPEWASILLETIPIGVALMDEAGRLEMVNEAFCSLLGMSSENLIGHHFLALTVLGFHHDHLQQILQTLCCGSSEKMVLQTKQHHSLQGERIIELQARALRSNGHLRLFLELEDVTRKQRAETEARLKYQEVERALLASHQTLDRTQSDLRALTSRLLTAQEEERRRIARELHDDIGQKAVLLEFQADRIGSQLPEEFPQLREELRILRQQAGLLSDSLRKIAHQLHPAILEDIGIEAALRALAAEFGKRNGMPVAFYKRQIPTHIPPQISANFFRVAQEALRNVEKHAGRTQVKVWLTHKDSCLKLRIRDYGRGFDQVTSSPRKSLGLLSMQERARLIGGILEVEAKRGHGVAITLETPLPPKKENT